METIIERCAGIDIAKKDCKVCVRTPGARPGSVHQQVRTFPTTTAGVLALRQWLLDEQVTVVAMESTGQYWRPVFYGLEETFECWLVNPAHVKQVPGRKTDVNDAQWIAQLAAHGLVRPSFVPPAQIRRLRDLTRMRTHFTRDQARHVQRLQDVLEDAGIKLAAVASDVMGVSGRAMIQAMIDGERDPERLADLALTRMRSKNRELTQALTGRFSDHHGMQARLLLTQIDTLQTAIDHLDTLIDAELATAPVPQGCPFPDYPTLARRLDTIPGVNTRIAQVLIAETGADMTRFTSPAQLSSWAGMCPGNNESAGKHRSTHTRKGDRYLKAALGQAATGAAATKNTHVGVRHRQLAARRGKQRALVATGRHLLEAAWWIMSSDTAEYHELGPDHRLHTRHRNPERRIARLLHELHTLGWQAHPAPVPA